MPSKKKRYNARFPPARIKKIMQTDEDVGKVAAAVPVIISRALELFIESLILKANETTQSRHAKTLSTAHIKQTIEAEKKFDFLRDLVACIPDHQTEEDGDTSNSSDSKKPRAPRQRKSKVDGAGPSRRAQRKNSSDSSHLEVDEDDDEETESDDEHERLSGANHPEGISNSHGPPGETFHSPDATEAHSPSTSDRLQNPASSGPAETLSSPHSSTDTSPAPAGCAPHPGSQAANYYPPSQGAGPSVSHLSPSTPGFPRLPVGGMSSSLSQGQSAQPYYVPLFNHGAPATSGLAASPMFSNLQMYKPPTSEDDDYDA
ncbi:dr1-associated corepressor-like [Liolophura sinensis]|uniref:dr1-associated corepressor-like n=1 Tax=Liolophura sinensis TaxID=3198878 RepID=UPI0031589086